jgi:hypothetical protein
MFALRLALFPLLVASAVVGLAQVSCSWPDESSGKSSVFACRVDTNGVGHGVACPSTTIGCVELLGLLSHIGGFDADISSGVAVMSPFNPFEAVVLYTIVFRNTTT